MSSPIRGMAPPSELRQDGVVVESSNPCREPPTLRRGKPRAAVKSGPADIAAPLAEGAQRPGPGPKNPLGNELLNAIERERERIARELHDGLGSSLMAVMLRAHALGTRRGHSGHPTAAAEARDISRQVSGTLQQLRILVNGLNPLGAGADSFVEALRGLTLRVRATKRMRCRCLVPEQPVGLDDPEVTSHLYRITEEAMHNALRHSGASHLTILFKQQPGQWLLRVSDNGCGFDPSAAHEGHGMRAMLHRARTIGGHLTIETRPGAGTRVSCLAPAAEHGR